MAEIAPASGDLVVGVVADHAGAVSPAFLREIVRSVPAGDSNGRCIFVVAFEESVASAVASLRRQTEDGDVLVPVTYALQPGDALDLPYHGQPGRARALRAILQTAQEHGARGCVVLDGQSASPGAWVRHAADAILADGVDYLAPVYQRHPFAGALIHGVVYPMFRALYGARLRYPVAVDLACSSAFAEAVLPEPVWNTAPGQLAIDGWLSATAVSNGFRVAQAPHGAWLGERTGVDLSTALAQVMGAFFTDMELRVSSWQRIRGSRALPLAGEPVLIPEPPEVDVSALASAFRLGLRELEEVWAAVLPPAAILQWRRLAAVDPIRVDDGLWARSVYDFAIGHRQRVMARDHLLRAFTPLYLGWLTSFVTETRQNPLSHAEARIEQLCLQFEAEKPYLISQWRWPERFGPAKLHR